MKCHIPLIWSEGTPSLPASVYTHFHHNPEVFQHAWLYLKTTDNTDWWVPYNPPTRMGFSVYLFTSRQRNYGWAPGCWWGSDPRSFQVGASFNWILLWRDKWNWEVGLTKALGFFQGYMRGVVGQHSPDGLTNFISSGLSATAINLTS